MLLFFIYEYQRRNARATEGKSLKDGGNALGVKGKEIMTELGFSGKRDGKKNRLIKKPITF